MTSATIDLGASLTAVTSEAGPVARLTISSELHDIALRFERTGGQVTGSLCYCGGRIPVDVTIQPGAMVLALDHEARELAIDPNRWRLAVARVLAEWHGGLEWCAVDGSIPPDRLLVAVIGAVTHPLLEPLYRAGRAPLREVPRWAVPVLRSATAAEAAATLVERPHRRLVRTLAACLQHGADGSEPRFDALALAVASDHALTADELANLLATEPFATESIATEPVDDADRPVATVDDIAAIRTALRIWPRDRRAPLLVDALAHHRLADIVTTFTRLQWVRDRVEHPLPVRLADVAALCARHVPVIASAPPDPGAARAPRAARTPGPRRARGAAANHQAAVLDALRDHLNATQVDETPAVRPADAARPVPVNDERDERDERDELAAPDLRWRIPDELLRIHRHRHGGVVFDVATSAGELEVWGRVLNNCVGAYGHAVASGAAWIIGMWANDELIGCIEVDPRRRRIVQCEGRSNRPLSRALERTVNEALHECGVTRAA